LKKPVNVCVSPPRRRHWQPAELTQRSRVVAHRPAFHNFAINNAEDLLAALAVDAEGARALAAGAEPITDDHNQMATAVFHDSGKGLDRRSLSGILAAYDPLQRADSWVFRIYRDRFSFSYVERRMAIYTSMDPSIPQRIGAMNQALAGGTVMNAVLREALEDVLASLEAGRDLASCFARHPSIFAPLFISIVRVGEATGTLETAFLRLADYLKQEQETKDRVKAAVRYPIIVLLVIALAVGIISTFVIPKFKPLFAQLGNDIPLPTLIIMQASEITRNYWQFVLAGIVVLAFVLHQYVSTEAGRYRWHRLKLRLPVLGKLLHEAILARITRSLAISLNAGMPMLQTLPVSAPKFRTTGPLPALATGAQMFVLIPSKTLTSLSRTIDEALGDAP